jgi:hypothetical protein
MAAKKTEAKAKESKAKKAKAPAKEAKAPKKAVATPVTLDGLDRKALAARARQIKTELMAIRFNLQSPSLRDYRSKKKELATVLARLGVRN